MPTIILRHLSDLDRLTVGVESLGYEFEHKWSPGDRYGKSRTHENFGFNLCLASEKDGPPAAGCLEEALQELDDLNGGLSAIGLSLSGCSIDIGVFGAPGTFVHSVRITAEQCASLGKLGVNFEASFYPSSPSKA